MHELRLRIDAVRRSLRVSLWFLPAVAVVAAMVAAEALGRVHAIDEQALFGLVFTGSADTAQAVLQTIATSLITVTGLTFSTAVVALQVATGQYTPRLLRNFLADRGNQVVLAGLVATFTYALVLLRRIRSGGPGDRRDRAGHGHHGGDPDGPGVRRTAGVLLPPRHHPAARRDRDGPGRRPDAGTPSTWSTPNAARTTPPSSCPRRPTTRSGFGPAAPVTCRTSTSTACWRSRAPTR